MSNLVRVFLTLLFAVLGMTTNGLTYAAEPVRGQEQFKEYCRHCHTANSDYGEYSPLTLIQNQWQRFFDRRYQRTHKSVKDPKHGNKPVTEIITPEILDAIREFSIEHAADTEHPMTCG